MFTQQVINGLSIGCVYALIAIGYSMVFGVLRFVNWAHGQLLMLGPMLTLILLGVAGIVVAPFTHQTVPLSAMKRGMVLTISLLAAAVLPAIIGSMVERGIYRPLRRMRSRMLLLSAFGVSIVLENATMLMVGRSIRGFPAILPLKYFTIAGARFSSIQVFMVIASGLVMIGLSYLVNRTYLGMSIRAVAEDLDMASLVGIDTNRVVTWVFVIGSAIGGISGLLFSMHYGQVFYFMGSTIGGKGWIVAILGGVGNIAGTAVAGLLLGLIETIGAGYLPIVSRGVLAAEYKDVFAFILLIFALLIRPQGLFGEAASGK